MRNSTLHDRAPGDRLFSLNTLEQSEGWALFLDRFAEKLRKELDEVALDTTTPAETTEHMKHARAFLTGGFSPEKVLTSLIVQTRQEVAALDAEAARRASAAQPPA